MSTLEQGMGTSRLSTDLWEEIARAAIEGIASQTRFDYGSVLLLGAANTGTEGPVVGFTEEAMAALAHRRASERRLGVASAFAERAKLVPGVCEVRLTSAERGLLVTVLTEDRDMERDLRLHALFAEVADDLDGESELQTRIFSEEEAEYAGSLLP